MRDFQEMMPHHKRESKFNHKVNLYTVNEMAEAKNCQKVMLFEGRAHKDLFFWMTNVNGGPGIRFEVSLIHYLLYKFFVISFTFCEISTLFLEIDNLK